MLSVCIPVYNQNIQQLVGDLDRQIAQKEFNAEIIVIDDASSGLFREINKNACIEKASYVQLKKNIGRARIRNLFISYARYDYLLFLDCDSMIVRDSFLHNYFHAINRYAPSVIFGGSIYKSEKPKRDYRLRWAYGIRRESKTAKERQLNPFKSFKTNNFIVKKQVFKEIQFEERLRGYGHEDTLFGFRLKEKNIPVTHTDNPVLNADLDTNPVFLKKTRQGIESLLYVLKIVGYNPGFINDIALLKTVRFLNRLKLCWFVWFAFIVFGSALEFFLKKGFSNMMLFSFYKLGYLCKLMQKRKILHLFT